MKIAIGCDHAAVDMKNALVEVLKEEGWDYTDFGVGEGEKCDYPDMAKTVCEQVASGAYDRGMLLCGTGIGMSMSANKIPGIRAALVTDCFGAKYTRLHNDANVICMGARTTGVGLAAELLRVFLSTGYEGGRHAVRVEKMMNLEKNEG